jgi:hypothetical protein
VRSLTRFSTMRFKVAQWRKKAAWWKKTVLTVPGWAVHSKAKGNPLILVLKTSKMKIKRIGSLQLQENRISIIRPHLRTQSETMIMKIRMKICSPTKNKISLIGNKSSLKKNWWVNHKQFHIKHIMNLLMKL